MPEDRYGLEVTTTSPRALEFYGEALDRSLAQQSGAEELLREAVAEDENFALAWALLGLEERGSGDITGGNKSVARAGAVAAKLTERERSQLGVLDRFVALDVLGCEKAMHAHADAWPRDAVIVMQSHFLYNIFDWRLDRDRRLFEFLSRVAPSYGDDWFMAAELAFAVDEVGDHRRARDLAEQALEGNAMNGRAAHGMSHALLEGGEPDTGASWLAGWLDSWDRGGSFGCHLWWHLALFSLALGDDAGARRAYERIWGFKGEAVGVATDAPSLAWRLHLDDPSEPMPWGDLAALPDKPGFTFGNMHRALVLAGLGDVAALTAYADTLAALGESGHPTATLCAAFARGLAADVRGDPGAAARTIGDVAPSFRSFGGSHAQGEVLDDTFIAVLARAGERDEAARRLRSRLDRRPSRRDERWVERIG